MIRLRSGGLLLVGIDSNNVDKLRQGYPLQVKIAEADNGEPVTEIVVAYGETLTDLVNELKLQGVLPPDMPFEEPSKPPRH